MNAIPSEYIAPLQSHSVLPQGTTADTREKREIMSCISAGDAPGRAQLEHFIYTVFRNVYGAHVTHFMPYLLSLQDQDEQVLAVCGMRPAGCEKLFLEAYLEQPIEAALSQRIGSEVARDAIVEVGNLAVSERGLARQLLCEVIRHLHETHAEWAVFTAIPALCNSLVKLDVQVEFLGEARIDKLAAADRAGWGSYYERHPQVMAVRRMPQGTSGLRHA